MDGSISVKPPAAASKSLAVRDPVTVREAVATDLGRSKTVAPMGDADGRPNDQRQGGQRQDGQQDGQRRDHPRQANRQADHRGELSDHAPQDVLVDPESRELIYRERDVRSADRPHPDQALLRQRAYRPVPAAPAEIPAQAPDSLADIKA